MSPFWKALVVLLLVLPVGAFALGSLAASRAHLPDRQSPVILRGTQGQSPDDERTGDRRPAARPQGSSQDRDDDGEDGDDQVRVVRPEPHDVGDDDGDDNDRPGPDGDDEDTNTDDSIAVDDD